MFKPPLWGLFVVYCLCAILLCLYMPFKAPVWPSNKLIYINVRQCEGMRL